MFFLLTCERHGGEALPNNACTRLVGVCAISSRLFGSKLVPTKQRYLVPPTSG